jgi:Protein of unknown function (DUF2971)
MSTKTYLNFEEVEEELTNNAPPVVYKYRTWTDANHKNVLLKNAIWFSHPFDLNDPLDVRPDFAYSIEEITSEAFYQHLYNSIPANYGNLSPQQKEEIAKRQWNKIKSDPDTHFNTNRKDILTKERYEPYGIFSTTSNCLSIPTWELYGDNHNGYAIGFTTVELARDLNCTAGLVTYSDEPFPYRFMKDPTKQGVDILLYKKTSWSYEEEFRFATAGVGIYTTRLRNFKPTSVAEVVLGYAIPNEYENEILEAIGVQYPNITVYKTKFDNDGSLIREKITY